MASKQAAAKTRSDRAERSHPGEPQIQREPKPPFPEQHQDSPGLESKLKPRPRYQASQYKAAGKPAWYTAFITGGDSSLGRAVAVLYARQGADRAISYLSQ